MKDQRYELMVVGAGPAGLTSGIYGVRSGLKTLILEEEAAGGKVAEAPLIDNYPGLEEITGMELSERMKKHASKYVEIREIQPVEKIKMREPMTIKSNEGSYETDAIVLATGTKYRKLGVPGEDEFAGRGVSYCATCDGFFFKEKPVLVAGGGNAAIADASYLLDLGCKVRVVHRRDELRAEKALQDSFLEGGGKIIWNSILEEIDGDERVKGARLRNVKDGSKREVEVDAVFISIGGLPRTDLASEIGVELDEDGYIKTDENQRTNLPRVYAAGDVTGGPKQVVTACSEGAIAALSAYVDLKGPYWSE